MAKPRDSQKKGLMGAAYDGDVGYLERYFGESNYNDLQGDEQERVYDACAEAALRDQSSLVSFLLDKQLPIKDSLLWNALYGLSTSTFQVLLEHGWNINQRYWDGRPTLNFTTSDPKLVQWFLDHGANPNALDFRCQQAIDYAAHEGRIESVKILIEGGTNIKECRALIGVMDAPDFHTDIAQYLLDQGVDINILMRSVDENGNEREIPNSSYGTALHWAINYKDPKRVKWLLERGADRNIKSLPPFCTFPLQLAEWDESDEILNILHTYLV